MRVVAFNGSPRKNGNTAILIQTVFESLEKGGIETELFQLGGKGVTGCLACRKCVENKDNKCVIAKDCINECIAKMIEADGIILASPTYFTDLTADMKALIDRAGLVSRANGNLFKRKVGAAVVAARRTGAIHVFNSINNLFFISEMIVAGSNYWNNGLGGAIGEVSEDEEGLTTMRVLGENMAWLMKKISA